ncbi:hypothetical protein N7490_005679 [Penicillium lividum]|nr:hypothetical protein N7490_005679 [Penicillium lividum]
MLPQSNTKDRSANSVDLCTTPSGCACGGVHSPSVKTEQLSDSKEVKKWFDNYLGVGEWVMDQSVAVMGSSSWFERRR